MFTLTGLGSPVLNVVVNFGTMIRSDFEFYPGRCAPVLERLETRYAYSAAVPVIHVPLEGIGFNCIDEDHASHDHAENGHDEHETAILLNTLASFSRNINFLPAANVSNPELLPEGYLPDTGAMYGVRSGESYGWQTNISSKMRYRTGTHAPDGRYATNVVMGLSDVWEIAVPNGSYQVRVVAGDAAYLDSTFKINVEGQLAINAVPSGKNNWVERTVIVGVADGRLTISSATGASNNKLAFVNIASDEPRVPGPTLEWTQGNVALPFHRVENGAVQIGSKLYVMGGFVQNYDTVTNSFQIHDFTTGTWTTQPNMPGSQTHFGMATDGRYIYKVAGQIGPKFATTATNEGWKYDTQTGEWSRIANLPAVRFGGATAYLDGRLHFWGGNDSSRYKTVQDHWTLDLNDSNATWQSAPPIPLAGDHLSHVTLNGKIYSIGGEHDHGKTYVQHDFVFEFNPATNQWTRKADMPTPSSHFEAATFAHDGKLWAIAGQVDQQKLTNEVRVFDPDRNQWSVATAFPEQRKGGTVALWQGKVYYISGDSSLRGTPGLGVPKGSWMALLPFSPVPPGMPTGIFGTPEQDPDDEWFRGFSNIQIL